MTTSNETRTFPPKQQVPAKVFLLVRVAKVPTEAKSFTKTVLNKETKEPEEKEVHQVNLHFQIADKRHPALCGQWHIMQATDYISDGSKLFSVLTAVLGADATFALLGKSCFPRTWPDGNQTPPEKLVPPDTFKGIVGRFFAAEFNPPKTNEDGSLRISDDGSPFQTVKDINTPAALGWTEDLWQLWPPPKPEDKPAGPLGLPQGNQPPAKAEDKPQAPPKDEPNAPEPPPLKRTFGTKADMVGELKVLVKAHADFVKLKDDFLALKGAPLVTNLSEDDVKHLLVLFWLEEHRMGGGVVSAQIGAELMTKHKALHQLTDAEAIFLLAASDHEATLDKNF